MLVSRVMWFAYRRSVWPALMVLVFLVLGYTGMMVMMKSPHYLIYPEAAGAAPRALHQTHTQGGSLMMKEEEVTDGRGPPAGPLVVLVVASMPRSGSTLLIDLLTKIQDSVGIFEPLWLIEKTECYKSENLQCIQHYLGDVFSCTFKEDFANWLKSKGLFFQYFNEQARHCLSQKKEAKEECLKAMNLQKLCAATPVLVVKVVRARLAWIQTMLEDSFTNLKVIHLSRDPRGSLRSISGFGWDSDPHSRCVGLEDDLVTYEKMRHAFPSKVMQVQHERLCLESKATIKGIFGFLFDNTTLPTAVNTFLEKHLLSGTTNKGGMSTFKNSTEEFQAWRFKINDKYLQKIETEPACLRSIQHMRHAVFGSQAAANNISLPLILNT